MPQARYRLVDTATTPYYHCMSRCVRRAFLCGFDKFTGKNFDHRKQWILDRIQQQSSIFAIDVCAYAIMSNHFHLVLHVDVAQAEAWSDDEVIDRWLRLYKGPTVANKHKEGASLNSLEKKTLSLLAEVWRSRLSDLSWFMRYLNEAIARLANSEDNCSGRFWEGRFKSQALLNEAALLSCMAYVDLNPIRAGLCESLESSEFTSIQERQRMFSNKATEDASPSWLKPLRKEAEVAPETTLPFEVTGYFALVDWTGRAVRDDKKGAIPSHIKPILEQLGIREENWVNNTKHFGNRFYRAVGRINQIRMLAKRTEQHWIIGNSVVTNFYS